MPDISSITHIHWPPTHGRTIPLCTKGGGARSQMSGSVVRTGSGAFCCSFHSRNPRRKAVGIQIQRGLSRAVEKHTEPEQGKDPNQNDLFLSLVHQTRARVPSSVMSDHACLRSVCGISDDMKRLTRVPMLSAL